MGSGDIAQMADGTATEIANGAVHHPFEFRGDSAEYFRIWIVNLALSLLTLGIFSAWAKVRRERYFYGNTWVAGAPFEYLASPINVLKGRLIAFALLVAYVGASQVSPYMQLAVVALVLIATPWIVVSTLRFRARYSAWSSVGFRFTGTLRRRLQVLPVHVPAADSDVRAVVSVRPLSAALVRARTATGSAAIRSSSAVRRPTSTPRTFSAG